LKTDPVSRRRNSVLLTELSTKGDAILGAETVLFAASAGLGINAWKGVVGAPSVAKAR